MSCLVNLIVNLLNTTTQDKESTELRLRFGSRFGFFSLQSSILFVKWSTLLRFKSLATEVKSVKTWTRNVAMVKLATAPLPHQAMLNNIIWGSGGDKGINPKSIKQFALKSRVLCNNYTGFSSLMTSTVDHVQLAHSCKDFESVGLNNF